MLIQLITGAPGVSTELGILKSMWELSPILALLTIAIIWLAYKNEKLYNTLYDSEKGIIVVKDNQIKVLTEKKEEQIKELNAYIRENDKENLEVLSSLNNTMDKLIQTITSGNDSLKDKIVTEATNIKNFIDIKIAGLKEKK